LTNQKFGLNCFSKKEEFLAEHLSVVKRLRQSQKANLRNRTLKSKIKTLIKKIEDSSDLKQAQVDLKEAVSLLDKATRLKVMHKNTATRTKTKLTRRINQLKPSSDKKD
jgi:small subunit ribosomal protein S20